MIANIAKSAAKSLLPWQSSLRRLKRRFVPYEGDFGNSRTCITDGLSQIRALRSCGVALTGVVLEFGTGWLPLIPLLLHLAGARKLVLTDVERLMDDTTVAAARRLVADRIDDVAEVLEQPRDQLLARLATGYDPEYLVPWEAGGHETGSVDLIVSRAVFEHVPKHSLEQFMMQFHRVLKPGGAMCHLVDNSDHWQHIDRKLSRINFLRFGEGLLWRAAQLNPQSYQNRLRHSDYLRLFEAAGFTVALSSGEPDPKCLRDLETLPLAPAFRNKNPEDLAILTSLFVLRRA